MFVSYFIIANVTPRCLYLNRPDIAHCFGTVPHQAGKERILGLWHLEALHIHVLLSASIIGESWLFVKGSVMEIFPENI